MKVRIESAVKTPKNDVRGTAAGTKSRRGSGSRGAKRAKAKVSAKPTFHRAVFAGSFDPVTYGHLDVIARGRNLFDEVVVAVGRNPGKQSLFSTEERLEMLRELCERMVEAMPEGAAVRVETFDGLTVDFARSVGANVLLRGIRNLSDLQNEVQQAVTNREVAALETAFVVAGQSFAYTSSSLIKQITAMGSDARALRKMVPPLVAEKLREKKKQRHPALVGLMAARDGE